LRQIGIQPDVLICRTEREVESDMKRKLGLFCNVPFDSVIIEPDVEHTIYEVPVILMKQGLDEQIMHRLQLSGRERHMQPWIDMIEQVKTTTDTVEIAVVGKYIALHDSYKSIYESLAHAGIANGVKVRFRKIDAEKVERDGAEPWLEGAHALLVPGGFGPRGVEGMILAIKWARENKMPFFGICLGLQVATIEYARHMCGLSRAHSTEMDKSTPDPVIDLMSEQQGVDRMGGTMRLGAYPCDLVAGTLAREMYGADRISERHRHRFEVNNAYRKALEAKGLVFSGNYAEKGLAEIIEYPDHPWFLAVQFHPEFQSKPLRAHPIFKGFVRAAVTHRDVLAKSGKPSVRMEPT
jgi:CTP synthase